MQPTFKRMPETTVVGMKLDFTQAWGPGLSPFDLIPELWGTFAQRFDEIDHRPSPIALGVCIEQEGELAAYIAGVPVTRVAEIPAGMVAHKIAAEEFAVFTHRGSTARIRETLASIYGSWLPNAGLRRGHGPNLEVYGAKFKPEAPEAPEVEGSELEIWVPIKR